MNKYAFQTLKSNQSDFYDFKQTNVLDRSRFESMILMINL